MIYPMMIQIDFAAVQRRRPRPKGLLLTLVVNWLIKPFTMAALGVLFFKYTCLRPWVDPQSASEYIAGMILLGVAPCTAMVFVWSQLVKGDANYTLVQVSVNDIIMVFAFAPIAAFLLGVTDLTVPWQTLLLSTVLYVVLPLVAGVLTRQALLLRKVEAAVAGFVALLKPWSVVGLIATVVLLFGFPGRNHRRQTAGHCHDRGAAHHADLRHLCAGVWVRAGSSCRTTSRPRLASLAPPTSLSWRWRWPFRSSA
jgi:arsenite transporter